MLFRCILILLLLGHGGAMAQPDPVRQPPFDQPQGWTRSELEIFSHSPVGSRLVPYLWFPNLEQAASQELFAAPESLARYGFIPAAANPLNPAALPVGLSRERDRINGPWLGMSCAACHTRAITAAGQTVLVEGAGAMLDSWAFLRDLSAALTATAADDAKFARFADRLAVLEPERPGLRERLASLAEVRAAAIGRDTPAIDPGPGRLDLLGLLVNATAATLGHPEDASPPAAPIRVPRLWGASAYDRTLSSGLSNAGLGPLLRNIGQVLATGGTVDLAAPPYSGSVSLIDLETIEALLRKLQPPPWPSAFPSIDPARAAQGAAIFSQACAGCHRPAGRDTNNLLSLTTVPAEQPTALSRIMATGPLSGRPADLVTGPPFAERSTGAVITSHIAIGIAAQLPQARFRAGLATYLNVPAQKDTLRALPLTGIWANAPFLHNGSVASLQQLLEPPAARAQRFSLNPPDYDPAAIGLPANDDAPGPKLDTSEPGNANTGHDYGTALAPDAKQSLLEYLKTL